MQRREAQSKHAPHGTAVLACKLRRGAGKGDSPLEGDTVVLELRRWSACAEDNTSELCQPCKGRCGPLARSWVLDAERGGLKAGAVLGAGAVALCERHTRAARGVCVPSLVRPSACAALLRLCSVQFMFAFSPV